MKMLVLCLIFTIMPTLYACNSNEQKPEIEVKSEVKKPEFNGFELVKTIDIDPAAFVQGLIYEDGKIYISTGLEEMSTLRKINYSTGLEEKNIHIENMFCEGIAISKSYVYQLTWKNGQCIVYDKSNFERQKTFFYRGEGWGLAFDGTNLIMSNGSDKLSFLKPDNFSQVTTIQVKNENDMPVYNLNELEYINGKIWANIWTSDDIIEIDPASGRVTKRINCSKLRELLDPSNKYAEVLNGIAFNPENKHLFLTGKFWGKIFEIKLL